MQGPLANMTMGFDRKRHRPLIGEADISRFVTSVVWRMVALVFAIAFAANVASTRNEAGQPDGTNPQTTAGSLQ